jgi:hypothetical protein
MHETFPTCGGFALRGVQRTAESFNYDNQSGHAFSRADVYLFAILNIPGSWDRKISVWPGGYRNIHSFGRSRQQPMRRVL